MKFRLFVAVAAVLGTLAAVPAAHAGFTPGDAYNEATEPGQLDVCPFSQANIDGALAFARIPPTPAGLVAELEQASRASHRRCHAVVNVQRTGFSDYIAFRFTLPGCHSTVRPLMRLRIVHVRDEWTATFPIQCRLAEGRRSTRRFTVPVTQNRPQSFVMFDAPEDGNYRWTLSAGSFRQRGSFIVR
jgi:hypothetical protein